MIGASPSIHFVHQHSLILLSTYLFQGRHGVLRVTYSLLLENSSGTPSSCFTALHFDIIAKTSEIHIYHPPKRSQGEDMILRKNSQAENNKVNHGGAEALINFFFIPGWQPDLRAVMLRRPQ